MEHFFLTPPLELFKDFLVVVGAIAAFYVVVSSAIAAVVLSVAAVVILILRFLVNIIRRILRFIFPWAFRSRMSKMPMGFHPHPEQRERNIFYSRFSAFVIMISSTVMMG